MKPSPLSDTYERYALGLSERAVLPAGKTVSARRLMQRLVGLGARGSIRRRTLRKGPLPRGCSPCLKGLASTVCVTTRCNRDCFFCFNPRPRADVLSVHGRPARSPAEAAELLAGLGCRSVGLSGGEPLLVPRRTLALARAIRARLPGAWIDVYTNGDLAAPALLRELRQAGVDGLRLNLAANGYDARPAVLATRVFPALAVEIPVVPEHEARVSRLMRDLAAGGVRRLILHELFWSAQNRVRLRAAGLRSSEGRSRLLTWSAVADSEACCLRLLGQALTERLPLDVHYCSTGTQEWIAQHALRGGGGEAPILKQPCNAAAIHL